MFLNHNLVKNGDFKNNLDVVCFVNGLMAKSFLDKNKKIKII